MAEKIIKGLSTNKCQVVGTVEEVNLKEDPTLVKSNDKDIKGAITRANLSNPSITIKTDNGSIVGINFFPIYKFKKENGKLVENSNYASMKTVMGYEKGTRVFVKDGYISANGYVGKTGEWAEFTQIGAFNITSTNVPEDSYAQAKISGVIKAIKSEMRGEDETGRKIVEFWYTRKNPDDTLTIYPINLIVEEDEVDDFEDIYEVGSRCQFDVDIVTKQVGSKKSSGQKAFGKSAKIVDGWTITEYVIIGGDAPMEEENNSYLDTDTFKQLLSERDVMIKAKKEEKKSGSSEPKRGLGSKSKMVDTDDSDPFGGSDSSDDEDPFK